jgi:hypothetical protein
VERSLQKFGLNFNELDGGRTTIRTFDPLIRSQRVRDCSRSNSCWPSVIGAFVAIMVYRLSGRRGVGLHPKASGDLQCIDSKIFPRSRFGSAIGNSLLSVDAGNKSRLAGESGGPLGHGAVLAAVRHGSARPVDFAMGWAPRRFRRNSIVPLSPTRKPIPAIGLMRKPMRGIAGTQNGLAGV